DRGRRRALQHLDLVDVRRVQVGDAIHGVVLIRCVATGGGGRDRVQVVADRVVADDDAVHDDQGVDRRVDRGDPAQVDLHTAAGLAVPTTATLAPAIALPSRLPVTFPAMARCCAARVPPNTRPTHTNTMRCATIPPSRSWFSTERRVVPDTLRADWPTRKPGGNPRCYEGFSAAPAAGARRSTP